MTNPKRHATHSKYIILLLSLIALLHLFSFSSTGPSGLALHRILWHKHPLSISSTDREQQRRNYQMAYDQSYGFFTDITNEHWTLFQQIARDYQPHMYPDDPLRFADSARRGTSPSWYQTNYEPNFSCPFERRVGGNGNGDGPKWVCDPHRIADAARKDRTKCLVYSIGSHGDFQFETALQQVVGPGVCEVHIFDMDDFSKEMNQWMKRYNVTDLHFHQWGLTSSTSLSANNNNDTETITNFQKVNDEKKTHEFKSIGDIVHELGHSDRPAIDIFKIDCESCEWDTYPEWLDDKKIPRLQQILIELHRSPPTKVLPFFQTLQQHGYAIFHKEPNIQHSQGNCIEYAFIKLKEAFFLSNE
eukprot:scaffold8976_cov126-Cylindrotheca_fusiformis.AAC.4